MDERTLAIVKAVALDAATYCDDWADINCAFCSASEGEYFAPGLPKINHAASCEVTLARQILKDMGTPVNIYKVEFEYLQKNGKKWRAKDIYKFATTEEEAIHGKTGYEDVRNVCATLIRELPLQG